MIRSDYLTGNRFTETRQSISIKDNTFAMVLASIDKIVSPGIGFKSKQQWRHNQQLNSKSEENISI